MLQMQDICFLYEGAPLLSHVSLHLKQGEIATLIGASGTGKTTCLKLITGLLKPHQGQISIGGQPLPEGHGNVSYMMQEDLLLPWRNVLQNMTLTAELGKQTKSIEPLRQKASALLKEIDMEGCEEMFPHQLSGGMRQRVALARALLQNRPLLLMDEPFGSLDVSLREHMYTLLRNIRNKYGTTILFVTHDFRDALSLSDRIFLLINCTIEKEWHITNEIRHNPHSSSAILEEMRLLLLRSH